MAWRKGTRFNEKDEIIRRSKRKQKARRKGKSNQTLNSTFKNSGKRKQRIKLLLRDGHKCAYCSNEDVPLEMEHLIPRSRGGSNSMKNLVMACRECNLRKGSKLPHEIDDDDLRERIEYLRRYNRYRKGH